MSTKHKAAQTGRFCSGWIKTFVQSAFLAALLVGLAGCGQAATPAFTQEEAPTQVEAQAIEATSTLAPTQTPLPTAAPTLAPTETPLPTATTPPTATPVPPFGMVEDGFQLWCAPETYLGTKPEGPDAPADARKMVIHGEQLEVRIPAVYCVASVRFNQPAPEGVQLYVSEANAPFLKLPLTPVEGQPDLAWTAINHAYVINPPLWDVTFELTVVTGEGKFLWTNPVTFAKPLPESCPYGGLPDPVTLWCAVTDPWEIEPYPDVTYPYDRSKLTPEP